MKWLEAVLKDYVTDEATMKEVVEKFNKEFPLHAVPKEVFNDTNEKLKDSKAKVDTLQQQILDSSKSTNTDETEIKELQAKIKTMEENFNTYKNNTEKAEINRTKKSVIENSLKKANVVPDALDLLSSTFNLEEIELNEAGEIADFESQLTKLKESKPSLFKVVETTSTTKPSDGNTNNTSDTAILEKVMGL